METEFKIGDKIKITEVGEKSKKYFSVGDIGKIIKRFAKGSYHINFYNKLNGDCIWPINCNADKTFSSYAQFKIYQEEKPRFHNAQPGYLLWNDELGICKIDSIDCGQDYPISVISDNSSDLITLEGKRYKDSPKATFFYYTPENHYLTERPEPKVDWTKAAGAKVKVCDLIQDKEPEEMILAFYKPELKYSFWVYDVDRDDIVYAYKYCSLAEPCKPEWRK